jgi:hypothetical protein
LKIGELIILRVQVLDRDRPETNSIFIAVIADEKYYEKISFLFRKHGWVITISVTYYK